MTKFHGDVATEIRESQSTISHILTRRRKFNARKVRIIFDTNDYKGAGKIVKREIKKILEKCYIKLTVHHRYNGLTSTICNCTVRNFLSPILCRLDILDRVVCNIYRRLRKTPVWNIHSLSFLFHTNLFPGKLRLASFGSWSWK